VNVPVATLASYTELTGPPELPAVASPRVRRLASLDLLRGVAILLVMGRHMYVTEWWHRIGWFGVQLFFVLSGFLVSGLLFREHQQHGRVDLRRFLVRRALKIYPGFFCFLLITLPLGQFSPRPPQWAQIAAELLFWQSYVPGYWEHTWSLAVEEHFYALLTLGMLLACRRATANPFGLVPRLTLAVGVACLTARAVTAASLPFDAQTHLYPTHLRLDALAFGACLAYWHHCRTAELVRFLKRRRGVIRLFAVAALASVAVADLRANAWMLTLGLTVSYLGAGALLLLLLDTGQPDATSLPPKQRAPGRFLCWLGRNSYAIYLWHMAVAVWGVGKIKTLLAPGLPYPAELVLYFGLSITLGALATWMVEQPILRLRDRWYPSRSGTQTPLPGTSRAGMQAG
jgi:peptidoglycan/LPS O-acetylase OafA/YrhL